MRIALSELQSSVASRLRSEGAGAIAADSVARSIVRAEADGIGLVGLGYLPTYLAHLKSGKVDGNAKPVVSAPRPAIVAVDAAHGFAHPAFDAGLEPLLEAARQNGMASMAISRSYSIGVLGHPVEDLASQGLVALAMTNSPPNIAPWGGRKPLFGTNPMAFAAPRRGLPPLVIDQATSAVTKVALAKAAKAGGSIPAHWALDSQGRPTTDAADALAGSMLPFGGAKGAGLALIIELLAAGLTGANFSKDASPYARADGPPPGVGQMIIAFDPDAFADGFLDRIADLAAAMLAQDGVRLPGDRRLAARARAEADSIELSEEQRVLLGILELA